MFDNTSSLRYSLEWSCKHWIQHVNRETASSKKATTQSGKLYKHSAGILFTRMSKCNWILVSNERKRNSFVFYLHLAMRPCTSWSTLHVLKMICFNMCWLSSCGRSYYCWSDFSLSHFHFPQTFTAGGPGAAKLIFTCLLECFLTAT